MLFLQLLPEHTSKGPSERLRGEPVERSRPEDLREQLNDILAALETDLEICLAPQIKEGARVRIKSGPLRGMEGFVERRSGQVMVMLRLDFIRQAAAVKMEAGDLELI